MDQWRPHDKIGVLGMNGGISLLYYTEGHGITFVGNSNNGDATPAEFFRQPARVLCLTRPKDLPDLRRQGIAVWVVARGPNMVLITNKPPPQR